MIQKLSIENFQSHKNTQLVFDPGVNVIVGASDSGKTAIIRALRWVTWNRPSGDSFRSSWGGDTRVEVSLDNTSVIRKKGTGNEYEANGIRFQAFGADVPEEVRSILNLNEINLQSQFDQPFLLTASPGEVANHFNKIAHLDKINTSIKLVQRWSGEIEQSIKTDSRLLQKAEEDLEEFTFLAKAEIELEVLEHMQSELTQFTNAKVRLQQTIKSVHQTKELIESKSELIPAETIVQSLLTLYEQKEQLQKQTTSLNKIISDHATFENNILVKSKILKAEKSVVNLLLLFEERQKIEVRLKAGIDILRQVRNTSEAYKLSSGNLSLLQTRFSAEMPDICPLCEQPIK
jgi:DNA repair exonuclease SbcCD ATPase subunit